MRPPSFLDGMGMPLRRCLSDVDVVLVADDEEVLVVVADDVGDDVDVDAVSDDVVVVAVCAFPCCGNTAVYAALVVRMMDHDVITFRLETEEDIVVLLLSPFCSHSPSSCSSSREGGVVDFIWKNSVDEHLLANATALVSTSR